MTLRKYTALVPASFFCLVVGTLASFGCRPASPPTRPAAAVVSPGDAAARQARDQQAQRYILQRRQAARKARRTHTSH